MTLSSMYCPILLIGSLFLQKALNVTNILPDGVKPYQRNTKNNNNFTNLKVTSAEKLFFAIE